MAHLDSTDLDGTHEVLFDSPNQVDHVSVYLTTLGHDAQALDSLSPRRIIRAGWWSMGADFDDGAGSQVHYSTIHWVDFEVFVHNFAVNDWYWDRARWWFPAGTVGRIIIN